MKKIVCLLLALILFSMTACQKVRYEYYSDDTQYEQEQDQNQNDDETGKEDMKDTDKTGGKTTVQDGKTEKTQKTTKTRKTRAESTTTGKTEQQTAATTEDSAKYETHTDTIKSLIQSGKLLAQGRAAMVGDEFQMDHVSAGFEIKGKLGGEIAITVTNGRDSTILNVVVDGADPIWVTVKAGESKTVLIPKLPKGKHTIKVISGTSARYGGLSVTSIKYDGELEKISRASNKLTMEVIGDSISCASGLDLAGKGPAWNGSITKAEEIDGSNAYYGYGAVAARALNADLSVSARCGYTMSQMKSYYKKLNLRSGSPNWDFAKNQVDIVVINLGTNGGGSKADVKNMILDVRGNYPNASIIWVSGMMSTATVNESKLAVQELNDAGDSKVFALSLRQYDVTGGYDGGHPTRDEHKTSGEALAKFIKDNVL